MLQKSNVPFLIVAITLTHTIFFLVPEHSLTNRMARWIAELNSAALAGQKYISFLMFLEQNESNNYTTKHIAFLLNALSGSATLN